MVNVSGRVDFETFDSWTRMAATYVAAGQFRPFTIRAKKDPDVYGYVLVALETESNLARTLPLERVVFEGGQNFLVDARGATQVD